MTKTLFGGGENKTASAATSGYGSLPSDIQQYFNDLAAQGSGIVSDYSQYFAPMGLTQEEQLAASMMLPENFGYGVSQYLNPFTDYLTQDINKAFEDQYGAFKQQADEAGAFGGSRYRSGMSDLEQARLNAIGNILAGQFNQAANQYQTGISNLLGFGGLERGVTYAQQQALPTALGFQASLINPLLGGSTSSSYGKGYTEAGIIPGLTGAAQSGAKSAATGGMM